MYIRRQVNSAIGGHNHGYLYNMMPESVFISYSRRDGDIVLALVKAQEDLRAAAFIDVENTPAGTHWGNYHAEIIQFADRFVLCWSRNAIHSEHVEREWKQALNKETKIIPVLLDDAPLPVELSHLHALSLQEYVDSFALHPYHKSLQKFYGFFWGGCSWCRCCHSHKSIHYFPWKHGCCTK